MSFRAAMEAAGLRPRDITPDGRFHRCPTDDKPRKRNGAYLLTVDGRRGYWRNFATESEWHGWSEAGITAAARDPGLERRMREQRAEDERRKAIAIGAARKYFADLPRLTGPHPYLERKQLTVRGCGECRLDGDLLAIPMRVGESLVSVQTIAPDGAKLYRKGCPTAGATYKIGAGTPATLTCFVEGFATGLAVFQSVPGARVVVCFDAANLLKVAATFKPRGLTVVCADNDHRNAINTGVEKGAQAAEMLRCGLAIPTGIDGTDWADAMLEQGAQRVRAAILREARNVV